MTRHIDEVTSRRPTKTHRATRLLVAACMAASLSTGMAFARGNDGTGRSREQIREFLSNASIVETEALDVGVTHSRRAVLEHGDWRHSAHVQTVNVVKRGYPGPRRVYPFFRDSYKYNVAASILDEMLGLGMVPVSVERKVGKERAAVTWWIDDVLMMERDRILSGTAPERPGEWADQFGQAKVFSALIANADFNPTNVLITEDWKLWLVDFTRAFRVDDWVELDRDRLPRLDRRFYEGLRRLDEVETRDRLSSVLSKNEIKTLLTRRAEILDLYREAIAEVGEARVICDRPGH